jgi:hypothetical protein
MSEFASLGDTMKVRRGKRKDFEALADIFAADTPSHEVSYRWYVKILKDLNHDLYVAEGEARILGLVSVGYFKSIQDGGRRAVIEYLGSVSHAPPGIKRKLVEIVLGRARKKNCWRIEASRLCVDDEVLRGFGLTEEVTSYSLLLPPKVVT